MFGWIPENEAVPTYKLIITLYKKGSSSNIFPKGGVPPLDEKMAEKRNKMAKMAKKRNKMANLAKKRNKMANLIKESYRIPCVFKWKKPY